MDHQIQSLHCHTRNSDGELLPEKLLDLCWEKGIGTVAFTDHDAVLDIKTIKRLREKRGGTKWISGIEMSSEYPKNSGISGDMHIVGLFVNPTTPELIRYCKKTQESRIKRMQLIVKNLRSLGLSISEKECLEASGGESIGRPHIVTALKSKPENLKVIESLRKKMELAAKSDRDINKKYQKMMSIGEAQYPYVLFLTDDSFISGVYQHYLYKLDMDESVKIIRNSGGLAFLAHWFTEIKKLSPEMLNLMLKENRLDGVETVYGFNILKKYEFLKQRNILIDLIKKNNKLESGGGDLHTSEDVDVYVSIKWMLSLTYDLAGEIIKKSKVDTTWSSYGKD